MTISTSSIDTVAGHVADVLKDRPSALLSDFDGTLSGVAPTPDAATMAPGVADVLAGLVERVDLAAIVTGRGLTDVMNKVPVQGLEYVGNHGLEWVDARGHHVHPAGLASESSLPDIIDSIRTQLAEEIPLDGVIFEDKRYSASIHYRLAENPAAVGAVLDRIVNGMAEANSLWISPGKMVIEMRPAERITKGSAVNRLASESGSRSMVFLGDDVTDTDAFIALHELKRTRGIATCCVGVLTADTHPLVVEHSDFLLEGVTEVVAMLQQVVDRLPVLDERRGGA